MLTSSFWRRPPPTEPPDGGTCRRRRDERRVAPSDSVAADSIAAFIVQYGNPPRACSLWRTFSLLRLNYLTFSSSCCCCSLALCVCLVFCLSVLSYFVFLISPPPRPGPANLSFMARAEQTNQRLLVYATYPTASVLGTNGLAVGSADANENLVCEACKFCWNWFCAKTTAWHSYASNKRYYRRRTARRDIYTLPAVSRDTKIGVVALPFEKSLSCCYDIFTRASRLSAH